MTIVRTIIARLQALFAWWMADIRRRPSLLGKAASLLIGLFAVCCVCSVPLALVRQPAPSAAIVATVAPTVSEAEAPTRAPAPTAPPAPTSTPELPSPTAELPSPTARPSATPVPPTATPKPTAAPEPTAAAPSVAKLGDRVELGGVAVTVTKAERTAQIGKFQKAQDGREFIVIETLIENVSADKAQADYNPFYFKIKDSEGFESNATIDMDPAALKSGNLDKGSKAKGSVVFDVAKGSKGFTLSYQNLSMTLSQTTLQWTLGDI